MLSCFRHSAGAHAGCMSSLPFLKGKTRENPLKMFFSSLRLFPQPPQGFRAALLPPRVCSLGSKYLHMTWQPSCRLCRLPKSKEAVLWPGLDTPWLGRAPWTRASPHGDLLGTGTRAGGRQARVHRASTASPVRTSTVPADPALLPSCPAWGRWDA